MIPQPPPPPPVEDVIGWTKRVTLERGASGWIVYDKRKAGVTIPHAFSRYDDAMRKIDELMKEDT